MATEVNLPELGESVTEGTVTRWLKQVGDSVAMDEPLLEISTDKVDTEIPSPAEGTLLEIKANEDDTVEVGGLLAIIGAEGEGGGSADAGSSESAEEAPAEEEPAEEAPAEEAPAEEAPAEEPAAKEDTPAPAAETGGSDAGGTEVKLPELGESVTEGTVTRWLKQVGDEVALDEPLLEVSTDKVDTEIPSPVAGTLLEQSVAEDETVEVGAVLGKIGDGSAAPAAAEAPQEQPKQEEAPKEEPKQEAPVEEAPKEAPATEEPQQEEAPAQPAAESKPAESKAPETQAAETKSAASSVNEDAGYVTPLVRKLANQHGVELASITGTGVGGRIRKQDVLDAAKAKEAPAAPAAEAPAAAAASPAAPAPSAPSPLRGKTEPLSRLRKVIAKRMVESLQISAQLTQVVEVDVTNVARKRNESKADFLAREGVKLSFFPFFAKATIDALKAHPALNSQVDAEKGEVTYFDAEHLAIAVDTERGLLSPVIHNAGDLNVAGLARKIADLADRTRNNKVKPDELSGGTFTLTNTGSVGALFDTPIINQPQVAILGTGTVVKRPVVIDDPNLGETIAVRHMCYLSLTYDHRIVDGADAARFLQDVKQRVESGSFEV
ncbi:2-oxoglutarate dehydrogenase, E2 component, dihydrolipoamide succinyltransferase [Nocardioides sp. JQ2195]|uniref:2-oxoglutarate dehydrogenase, E2 component, dihydrolipoamide succinyltransferase n=1 Tax=Nocardioides sp. JQ2195 TaxID=2592334 RepID=UPI00143ED9ED|nr:2-oxoglutarate dehydrogenase, E2 component, dihydrolipoamide succinyltransferase [Nocardioides sp. JQ2195]QIX27047.1 2-oxoglutarate dehydrogenase, E2 component, dihydrolipoamide succinyltransferase [Nocardioides sp. JQ2195]